MSPTRMAKAVDPQAAVSVAQLLAQHMDPALTHMDPAQVAELIRRVLVEKAGSEQAGRWQDKVIERMIPHGASVLDLGCGDGQLLQKLMRDKQVRGQGIELDAEAVFGCVERGVPVFQANLDEGLKGFPDHCVDYVVLEETLQTLHRPAEVLKEMLRVGRRGIVSFPNFAAWRVRLDFALRGRMPITEMLPYGWYDTPNIHLLTLLDFQVWAKSHKAHLVESVVLCDGQVRPLAEGDNLMAEEALFMVEAAG